MAVLRFILLVYALIGIFVSGGFFFNKKNKANIFLAGYLLVFSIGQIYFAYSSSELIYVYPEYMGLTYSLWMLCGPFLWFYVKYYQSDEHFSFKKMWKHFVPWAIYLCFTGYLLTYPGAERLAFGRKHFMDVYMPFNYGIAAHLTFYGVLILREVKRLFPTLRAEQKLYLRVLSVLYLITGVVEAYLTAFAGSYSWFIYYFLLASSIMMLVGYVLYFYPNLLHQITKKYYTSSLSENRKKEIAQKILSFLAKDENLLNRKIDLKYICEGIQEKSPHISQTISQELNTTLKELINKNRVEYAKKMLHDPAYDDQKIFAIALDAGFTNKSTFNRAFAKYVQMTPNEFRKKRGVI